MLKKLSRGITYQLYKFSILTLVLVVATVAVFGTSKLIKSTINSSGILESIRDSAILSAQSDKSGAGSSINFSDPKVVNAFKGAFSAEFLQSSSNNVIDGIYDWLGGKTKEPRFTIDLKPAKQKFANSIGDLAVERVKGLPSCTLKQLRALNPNNIDPFTLECQPQGLNLSDVKSKVVALIVSNNDFLKDAPITTTDIPKDNQGKNMFDNSSRAPQIYQWSKKLPYIVGVLAVLTAILYVYLHDKRRRGIWLLARGMLFAGLLLVISIVVTNYIASNFKIQPSGGNDANLQHSAIALIKSLTTSFNNVVMVFGIAYSVTGAIGLLVMHLTKPKTVDTAENTKPAPGSSESATGK